MTQLQNCTRNIIVRTKKNNDASNNNLIILGGPTSAVAPGDIVAIQTRLPDRFYPEQVTKFVLPPKGGGIDRISVVYEDEYLAVVNKPENMTTIGGGDDVEREDLQSCLGFVLCPPPAPPGGCSDYLPRPVHRLDRRTSGLVLVAKTQSTMRFLSQAFASRTVLKTYTALVQGGKVALSAATTNTSTTPWETIDYPIDGKSAVSEWRALATSNKHHPTVLSLVQVRPHTGRTHQIRRHLAYCQGMPIVGDAKYDKGATHLRTNGMYLCCHILEFPHQFLTMKKDDSTIIEAAATHVRNGGAKVEIVQEDQGSRVKVSIPLPSKFCERLEAAGYKF